MTQVMTYPPQPVFYRRCTAVGRAGILLLRIGLAAGILVGLFEAAGVNNVVRTYIWSLVAIILLIALGRAIWTCVRGGVWECRIDGRHLTLVRPDHEPLVVCIDDIRQWVNRRILHGMGRSREPVDRRELHLADGRIIPLNDYAVGRLAPLRRALCRLNPAIEVVSIREDDPAMVITSTAIDEPK